MKQKSAHVTTTFQINATLHEKLKLICLLTKKSMGEFIRLAIIDKINQTRVGDAPR